MKKLLPRILCLATFFACLTAAAQPTQTNHVASAIAGRWAADASFSATQAGTTLYWWTGKLWGQIEPTGKFVFKAENGCLITGVAQLFTGGWTADSFTQNCDNKLMNQRYGTNFSLRNGLLVMTNTRLIIKAGHHETFDIKATLSKY